MTTTGREPLPEQFHASQQATEHTRAAHAALAASLDFDDVQSFEDARRGFIATLPEMRIIRAQDGKTTFDLTTLDFLDGERPDTVNPSLWRQARLNALHHGLFEVCDGIWQVRSFDIANMTLIRGDRGWIIIDPLTSAESAAAALALANEHLGERPVTAVIITHSHGDHFGGIYGVVSNDEIAAGHVPVIVPERFTEEALSENVLAGPPMQRRATYMYGNLLPPGPCGFVTTGLGAALSMGTTGFAVPTDIVRETGERRTVDGIEIVFQMTMGTEAPSEMVFYFPAFRALCMSEITSHHLHNVYTPRGAQVRDALAWAAQIQESIDLFGEDLELQFASHHWPIWGRERAIDYLKQQRDLYKYIHDQTLRLANHGYDMDEIAEQVKLPPRLARSFFNRDYYGTVHHNARAVYVKYLGYFDGNPANLYRLPQVKAAPKYLEYMGGAEAVLERARADFEAGEYRWVAEVLNLVVRARPDDVEARALLAATLEQLGYQAESAPWRNFYLSGAMELRRGVPAASTQRIGAGIVRNMPLEELFKAMAIRLNGPRAATAEYSFNLNFTDQDAVWNLMLENAVLHAFAGRADAAPTATLTLASQDFKELVFGLTDAAKLVEANRLTFDGDIAAFAAMAALFDRFDPRFPLVTPRPAWD